MRRATRVALDAMFVDAVEEGKKFRRWPDLKEYLTENGMSEKILENHTSEIFDSYLQHTVDQESPADVQISLPDTPPLSEPDKQDGSGTSTKTKIYPTIDPANTSDGVLDIHINHKGIWDGMIYFFCIQEESFISRRIVERHQLRVKDGRTRLTWRWSTSEPRKSIRTFFIVVNNDDDIEGDIMLGKGHLNGDKEDESRDNGSESHSAKVRSGSMEYSSPTLQTYLGEPSQCPVDTQSAVEEMVARMNLHSSMEMVMSNTRRAHAQYQHALSYSPYNSFSLDTPIQNGYSAKPNPPRPGGNRQ